MDSNNNRNNMKITARIKHKTNQNDQQHQQRRTLCGFIGSCYSTSENICETRTEAASTTTTKSISRTNRRRRRRRRFVETLNNKFNCNKQQTKRTPETTSSRLVGRSLKIGTDGGHNLVSFTSTATLLLIIVSMFYILMNTTQANCKDSITGRAQVDAVERKLIRRRQTEELQGDDSHQPTEYAEASAPALDDPDDKSTNSRTATESQSVSAGSGVHQLTSALPLGDTKHPKRLQIVRLFVPEAVQNGTQNVTLDCMFYLDKRRDRRLTIKWFFNDELEPIYQWIPELNKRVYSDKYERFIDKNYQVTEDVDFMLQAYKNLFQEQRQNDTQPPGLSSIHNEIQALNEQQTATTTSNSIVASSQELLLNGGGGDTQNNDENQLAAIRKLLANRLNRHARFGSEYSRQFLDSLKKTFAMDQLEFSRFRALRLIRPTTELAGRFTCSISSLESDDLRSTNLVVYEPAKDFTFNVSRAPNHSYNLTCQAGAIYPRPNLALFRYRAITLDQQQQNQQQVSSRPKLAATSLRQEPLAGTQTQITISASGPTNARHQTNQRESRELYQTNADNELFTTTTTGGSSNQLHEHQHRKYPSITANDGSSPEDLSGESSSTSMAAHQSASGSYDISAWALIDENSLSGNVVTQFECVLSIEGTNYEQRQSLALQKGWHVNSSALTARSTLVGLFSALASLLCLILALVSSMLIFKLLRRHANQRRIHQAKDGTSTAQPNGTNSVAKMTTTTTTTTSGSSSSGSADVGSANTPTTTTDGNQSDCSTSSTMAPANGQAISNQLHPSNGSEAHAYIRRTNNQQTSGHYNVPMGQHQVDGIQQVHASDGIYRVPTSDISGATPGGSTFGTRFVIGHQQQQQQQQHHQLQANYQRQWQLHQQQYGHLNLAATQPPDASSIQPATRNVGLMATRTGQHHMASGEEANRSQHPASPALPATISVNGRALYC